MRQFASLNTRIALAPQDQVSVLEEKLEALDARYSRCDAEDLHNGSFRDDREDRAALVENIVERLIIYSESAPPRLTQDVKRKSFYVISNKDGY